MTIENANIVITGAASGFGKAMAIAFSAMDAKIIALDINNEALELLHLNNHSINVYPCDITNNEAVEKTIKSIISEYKTIDVLINNAGIMKNAPLINILDKQEKRHSIDLWNNVIAINQNAVFYTTRSVAETMVSNRNKGLIINISSIAAQGNSGQTAYSASKAAVEAMTKVWAKELGRFGIRSVAIAPGFINTTGTHDALEEKMLEQWVEKTPLRRTGTVDEIVKTVQFVIENDFVNGEVISVNGGLTV